MNVFFFGYTVPSVNQEKNQALSPIGNNMQLGILKEWGKLLEQKINIYTFYPLAPYRSSKILIKRSEVIEIGDGATSRVLPFINITVIKQICVMVVSVYYLIKDLNNNRKGNNVVITYHVSFFYSIPVLALSKIFKYKTVCLITDSPIDANKRENKFIDGLRVLSNILRSKLIVKYDAYLTINEYVMKELKIEKPFMPIYVGAEIVKKKKLVRDRVIKKPIKIIYTGAIEKYYNIDKMISAMKILGANYELHLYGKGSFLEKTNYRKVSNVKYHGFISNKEVRDIQIEADILICLLSKDSYLGKHAFPGKIFEYLLSTTPIVSCRTPSISSELVPFLNFIESETAEGIAKCISQMTNNEYNYNNALLRAENGRQFVVNNCTWEKQAQKVHKFIREITKETSSKINKG